MDDLVLDAWAVVAWLKGQQPAADRVRELLDAADRRERRLLISIINLGEVFYICAKLRDLAYAQQVLHGLKSRLVTVSASDDLVLFAATLKAWYPISYADAFAAATAIRHGHQLVTGDPELKNMAEKSGTLRPEWIAPASPA